jgi:hypothetical protein
MRAAARRFRGFLISAGFVLGAAGPAALAQELQLDPNALDPSGASASARAKGKKAKAQPGAGGAAAGRPSAGGPNRQFGELEGWSPGKAPPPKDGEVKNPKEKSEEFKAPPIGMSPSGNMSVGLPF